MVLSYLIATVNETFGTNISRNCKAIKTQEEATSISGLHFDSLARIESISKQRKLTIAVSIRVGKNFATHSYVMTVSAVSNKMKNL